MSEVMRFLISSYWVIGEARNLGVDASAAEVHRRFEHIRRQQFPKYSEFKAFLRSSGQTLADVMFRVRVNLLTEQIQRRVLAGHSRSSREAALITFVREFHAKWRAQTYCSPAYAVGDCGHVQSVL